MANKTIAKPTAVPKQFTLAIGWYLFFKLTDSSTNIIDGMRLQNWNYSGITYTLLDNNDQSVMDVFERQVASTADPGNVTARVFFDPRRPMPDVNNQMQTINEGSYGKVIVAVNDQGGTTTTTPLQVWMECDAVLQSYANIEGTYGEILYSDFNLKLAGKPTFYEVAMTGMTTP
jgi:hypothetical protein